MEQKKIRYKSRKKNAEIKGDLGIQMGISYCIPGKFDTEWVCQLLISQLQTTFCVIIGDAGTETLQIIAHFSFASCWFHVRLPSFKPLESDNLFVYSALEVLPVSCSRYNWVPLMFSFCSFSPHTCAKFLILNPLCWNT